MCTPLENCFSPKPHPWCRGQCEAVDHCASINQGDPTGSGIYHGKQRVAEWLAREWHVPFPIGIYPSMSAGLAFFQGRGINVLE